MILNIRGTSGSGKSYIVHAILKMGSRKPLFQGPGSKPYGYCVTGLTRRPIIIIGSYENKCGGCDGISTPDEICQRVRTCSKLGHVIFEGLLISHTYQRYKDLAAELGGIKFLFLDTDLQVCIDRVAQRRKEFGNDKPFNTKNTVDKWNDNRRCFKKFKDSHSDVEWLKCDGAVEYVLSAIKSSETTTPEADYERPVFEVFSSQGSNAAPQRVRPEATPQPRQNFSQPSIL